MKKDNRSDQFTPDRWYRVWWGLFDNILLADLKRLLKIPPQKKGGLNFVIAMMCMVTMDLLGKLLHGSATPGRNAIYIFLRSKFYTPPPGFRVDEIADILNTEVRNYLIHAFYPNRQIGIGRAISRRHFTIAPTKKGDRKLLLIDADTLGKDLLKSIKKYKQALIADEYVNGKRLRKSFVDYINRYLLRDSDQLSRFIDKYS